MTISENKSYTVKNWFADKVAQEVRSNISMCDVFAVLKETEKAVYAMLNLGCLKKKTMWVPKSVLVEDESGHNVIINDDYDKVSKLFVEMWKDYM